MCKTKTETKYNTKIDTANATVERHIIQSDYEQVKREQEKYH